MMVAEAEHRKGEEGALLAKRFLESTTYINITFSVYDDAAQTTLIRLDGKHKRYDLTGVFLGDNRRPLFVEVKNYTNVGNQPADYDEFLANAYSTTARDMSVNLDRSVEYMWITRHPFSQTKWSQLTSDKEIIAALDKHADTLNGAVVDSSIVRKLADRLWLVMMNSRQEEFLLTREELFLVHRVLQRKGIG